jgi:hypothetical protein
MGELEGDIRARMEGWSRELPTRPAPSAPPQRFAPRAPEPQGAAGWDSIRDELDALRGTVEELRVEVRELRKLFQSR